MREAISEKRRELFKTGKEAQGMETDKKNAMKVFSFEDHQVRVAEVDGEPWWVVNDVCEILEIKNPRDAVARIDKDDVAQTDITDSLGRAQKANVVNEAGLYELIFRSEKPEAQIFRRWITHEVLPAIRKIGSYSTRKEEIPADPSRKVRADAMLLNAKARLAQTMEKILGAHASRISDASVDAYLGEVLYMATGVRALTPKTGKSYTSGELAEEFGVTSHRVGMIATKYGLRNERYGFFFLDTTPQGKQVENFRYSEDGRAAIRAHLIEDGYFSDSSAMVSAEALDESA
jgi:prophage antirepressor-like protein